MQTWAHYVRCQCESCIAGWPPSREARARVIRAESCQRRRVQFNSPNGRVGVATLPSDARHPSYTKLLVPIICIRGRRHTYDVRLERRWQLYCDEKIHMWVVILEFYQSEML